MDDFGTISSIESLPLPEGPHVKQFDAAQSAVRKAARAAKKVVHPSGVTRQVSRNLVVLPAVTPGAFQSLLDFVNAYTTTDKTIADLTGKFVDAADVAKQRQDDIVPHLAFMQALLSKRGANHELVIEARKQGNKIAWWTEYYESYSDKLWQSLRTMERRIAAYRKDPSVSTTKPGNGGSNGPKHLTQLEHKLLGTATSVHEALTDIHAGRIDDAVKKLNQDLPTQDRIAEFLERGVSPPLGLPSGPDSSEPMPGGKEPIELPLALPANAPVPQTGTYGDWESHRIPAPDFKLKYFEEAAGTFTDRYQYAFRSSAFKKILAVLKDRPEQVLSHAHDFGTLAVVLRGAADNLNLLAAAIMTALIPPDAPEPGLEKHGHRGQHPDSTRGRFPATGSVKAGVGKDHPAQ